MRWLVPLLAGVLILLVLVHDEQPSLPTGLAAPPVDIKTRPVSDSKQGMDQVTGFVDDASSG